MTNIDALNEERSRVAAELHRFGLNLDGDTICQDVLCSNCQGFGHNYKTADKGDAEEKVACQRCDGVGRLFRPILDVQLALVNAVKPTPPEAPEKPTMPLHHDRAEREGWPRHSVQSHDADRGELVATIKVRKTDEDQLVSRICMGGNRYAIELVGEVSDDVNTAVESCMHQFRQWAVQRAVAIMSGEAS